MDVNNKTSCLSNVSSVEMFIVLNIEDLMITNVEQVEILMTIMWFYAQYVKLDFPWKELEDMKVLQHLK